MTLKIMSGSVLRPVAPITAQIGGVSRPVRTGRIQVSGVLQTFYVSTGPMTVTVSPLTAVATGSGTITTGPCTATPVGGVGPYTYFWVQSANTGDVVTTNAAGFATTSFTQTYSGDGVDSCDGTVTVTDSLGATASAPFHASFRYTGP